MHHEREVMKEAIEETGRQVVQLMPPAHVLVLLGVRSPAESQWDRWDGEPGDDRLNRRGGGYEAAFGHELARRGARLPGSKSHAAGGSKRQK